MGRAVGDAWGQISGSERSARASERAASAQRDAANAQYGNLTAMLGKSADQVSNLSVRALLDVDNSIAAQEKNIARQEKLLSSIDPTIMEASQQALKLLRGEDASTLAPLKKQRDLQRQRLLNQLREQLGPGAETSTAGIQALTRFDSETDSLFAGAQQQALGNLGQISGQFSAQRPDMLREVSGLSSFQTNRLNAGMLAPNYNLQRASALQGAGSQVINSAGAQFTGDLLRGQAQSAFTNDLLKAGLTAGVSALAPAPKAKP